MQRLVIAIICLCFVSSFGKKSAMQRTFEQLPNSAKLGGYECLKNNSLTLTDLKDYEKAEQISEKELCFYKCWLVYTQGIDDKGKLCIGCVEGLARLLKIDYDKAEGLMECAKKIDSIRTCEDYRKYAECLMTFVGPGQLA